MTTAVVWDTETTGLTLHDDAPDERQPRMIEFGGVLIDDRGAELDSLSLLVNPGIPLEPVITKVTGLTDEDLKDAPRFPEVADEITTFMARADIQVAHNLPFDESILNMELRRNNVLGLSAFLPRQKLCTAQTYAELWGKRPRLIQLYEKVMGEPLAQTHRALDDSRALAEIVVKEGLI